jgi:hypothetical protein
MKAVVEHMGYNKKLPEFFPWQWCCEPKAAEIAAAIVERIQRSLRDGNKHLIPSLRAALNIIAEKTELVKRV